MRRLFLTHRSPYARKVQLSLARKRLPYAEVLVDLANRTDEFVQLSPFGKVPVLVDEDGTVVCDSTVICEYLEDRYPHPPLRGEGWEARLAVRQVEEIGDSLADQAIASFFGRQGGLAAQVERADKVMVRLLDTLEGIAPPPGVGFCGDWGYADAAVQSALGYLSFRLGDGWRPARPQLAAWFEAAEVHPDAVATRPRG